MPAAVFIALRKTKKAGGLANLQIFSNFVHTNMEPAELISAIRAGSREAFDEMCGRYYAPLTAYARLFAGFAERLPGGQVLFRNPSLDQPGEHRVAGHLQMGGENSLAFRQCGQLRLRTLQRRMEPPGLGHGVACRGRSSGGCAALQHERCPDGDPRRRDSSDREHHSRMPAMKSVTARTAAASSPPSAQTSTSVPCLSPNARSERMLTALASRAAVRRVILAGASPLINFTSSPAGRACMPFGAVIVTFPVVI